VARSAARSGASEGAEYRARLEALRDDLTARLPDASDRDAAALAARLESVLATLAGLRDGKAASAVDQLAAKRAARRSGAQAQ
jgi:predicted phage-related endonuclease